MLYNSAVTRCLMISLAVSLGAAAAVAAEPSVGPRWSGFYAGGHAGWAWSGGDLTYLTGPADLGGPAGSTGSEDRDGAILGGQLGYQVQIDRIVAGLEVSFSNGDFFGRNTQFPAFDVDESVTTRLGSLFLATGRLGYLVDPGLLIYVKGGYAASDISVRTFDPTACCGTVSALATTKERHSGWTIGGGFEKALGANLTIGVEYNYVDLGAEAHSTRSLATDGFTFAYDVRIAPDAIHAVSVRLNMLLGGF